jgi:hypothetical protein
VISVPLVHTVTPIAAVRTSRRTGPAARKLNSSRNCGMSGRRSPSPSRPAMRRPPHLSPRPSAQTDRSRPPPNTATPTS